MINEKRKNMLYELVLWVFSLVVLYPLAMVAITSFKSYGEAGELNISLPEKFLLENYKTVFIEGKIFRSFINSTVITVGSVILIIMLSSILAFIITRNGTRINKVIYNIIVLGIIAPFAALPTIQLLKTLHIYGSYLSVILVYTALFIPFSTMLFSGFVRTIPKELDEAGIIDGCEGISLFYRIIFPLLLPVTVTAAVLNFMWVWNDFQYPIYLLNSSQKWTLPLSVYNFFGKYNRSWHLVCADMVMVSAPVILLYLFAQKYIIAGMTAGAIKG